MIAYGIRNPAGFAFPSGPSIGPASTKNLYVVENGASIGGVAGIAAAFANDNPADELELVSFSTAASVAPKSYGFPDCTSLWNPSADPVGVPQYLGQHRGDQFSLNVSPTRDDAWCKDPANNKPPALTFQVSADAEFAAE